MNWYNTLNKPVLTPPNGIFAPAWTILYIMIGLSFYFFIKDGFTKAKILPTILFIIQLILNLLWTPVFFAYKSMGFALIILILLWITTFVTLDLFWRFSKIAAYLLIPYILWLTFALYLNIGFCILN